ncbi:nicotianamine [Stylosanthes scabra]|uniref:Nicotianamine synthase n=1 Tax=Stylosanthes scabra TaxID=79078 RepID=A0ABU6X807_9FABA|nr:nicotianamine [Stylosanthes scabra]
MGSVDMVCSSEEEALISKICHLYSQIASLDSLKPCKNVDTLFTDLVMTCIPPSSIDVTTLSNNLQEIRSNLIRLCGIAEGHLEHHYSTILGSYDNPLHHLHLFPYYNNYLKLALLEFTILSQHNNLPHKIAFVGSGPLPLTSIVLASNHLPSTTFHNYDIDASANSSAMRLVSGDPDLSKRMEFHTSDILDVTCLEEFEVVYLAALVGMEKEEKNRVIDHLAKHMAPGAVLMLRSAHGARAFLYPVVEPCDLRGFEVLSVFHPTDEVINSVVIARKYPLSVLEQQQQQQGLSSSSMILPNKCSDEIQVFNRPLNHGNIIIEELTLDDQL